MRPILFSMVCISLVSVCFAEADVSDKDTQLFEAAKDGDLSRVKRALAGSDVDVEPALLVASQNGHLEVVKFLLDSSNKNLVVKAPLSMASKMGHTEVVKLLLEHDPDGDSVSLANFVASEEGYTEIVELLLDNGAEVNITLNDTGTTPLLIASKNGHSEVVKLLLEKGAMVNVRNPEGTTSLMTASVSGHSEVVKLLLEQGADVNAMIPNGWTALLSASTMRHSEVVKLLLEKGADINVKGAMGITPLWYASANGHTEIVKLLLDNGADIKLKVKNTTPLEIARHEKHTQIIELLEKAAAGQLETESEARANLRAIFERVGESVVVIQTYSEDGERLFQGSGFIVNDRGDIITNRHVLEGARHAEIKTRDGRTYPIRKVLAEDNRIDLIRISVDIPQKEGRPLTMTSYIPEVGEKLVVIGSPLGVEQTVSDGIVSDVREIAVFGEIIQLTAPIFSGSSGSPVVNMKGEVIAIATFQMIKGENLNFAIPIERIFNLIPGKEQTLSEWEANRKAEGLSSVPTIEVLGLSKLDSWIIVAASIKRADLAELPLTSQTAAIYLEDGRAFSLSGLLFWNSSPTTDLNSDVIMISVNPTSKLTRTKAHFGKGTTLSAINMEKASLYRGTRFSDEELYVEMVFDVLNANGNKVEYLRVLNMNYTPIPLNISKSLIPLPQNGTIHVYSKWKRIAPLRIVTSGEKVHYFVKLTDWNTDTVVQTIFVCAGRSAETTVPLGSFRLKYATGETWQGEDELFGDETIFSKAEKRFDFTQEGNNVSGYRVELILQTGGNLSTVRIPKSEW